MKLEEVKPESLLARDDLPFPQGAIQIGSDATQCSTQGGGFVMKTAELLKDYRFHEATQEELGAPMQPEYFQIEDGKVFKGWHNGMRWNGWMIPHFDFETAKKVCEDGGFDWWKYHEQDDCFYTFWEDSDDIEEWTAGYIQTTDGQTVKTYSIGGMCWIWSDAAVCCDGCRKYVSVEEVWTNSYDELVCKTCTDTPNRGPLKLDYIQERLGWG